MEGIVAAFEADAFLRQTSSSGPERCHIQLDCKGRLTLTPESGVGFNVSVSRPIRRTSLSGWSAVKLQADGKQFLIDFYGATWWMDPAFHKAFGVGRFRFAEFNRARRTAKEFKRRLLTTAP